eukprot:640505-Amphidinium_carterae.1
MNGSFTGSFMWNVSDRKMQCFVLGQNFGENFGQNFGVCFAASAICGCCLHYVALIVEFIAPYRAPTCAACAVAEICWGRNWFPEVVSVSGGVVVVLALHMEKWITRSASTGCSCQRVLSAVYVFEGQRVDV